MKEKTPLGILIQIVKILDELKIGYYVTGGFAVSIWGKPRFTADIDLIIKMSHFQKNDFAREIKKILPQGYVDKNQIESALRSKGEFNVIDPNTGLKIDFWIAKNEEFEDQCFRNSSQKDVGYKVNFISPEDLVVSKLVWFKKTKSLKHLEDAQTVLDISKTNKKYLQKWALKLQISEELEQLKI